MRLRKIRLAGFKSFVDPTTIEFPGNVVGVVGPNGCGKSNVIDAVRWVMGEVSARSLRGATMADVVFSGSRTRKPVSRASVELVFDNLDGRAGGRFAAYNEIAVRRQLAHEGQSSYWLNGTRCRRRDVMDVFHGTGLGPRSYAIIEQGMIARIIEARPEDLRDFLEEAAGISRYKERRRETEHRMRHTLENLDRLNDLREELAQRLAHLKRQATLAEKFRELKAAQRELEAEHLALQWRTLDEEAGRDARRIAGQQSRLDATLASQRRVEAELEKARSAHAEAADTYNRRYRDVLEAGAEIARTEESIESIRRRRAELAGTLRQETGRLEAARLQIEAERKQRDALAARLALDEPALAELLAQASDAHRELGAIEEDVHVLHGEIEALNEREREPAQAVRVEQVRIGHLESSIGELEARARALEAERGTIDSDSLERDAAPAHRQLEAMERELEAAEAEQSRAQDAVRALRDAVHAAEKALHDTRDVLGQHRGRAASLDALQQQALGAATDAFGEWLEARGLADTPRLAQSMRVSPGWEHAVETVLGVRLQAVRADAFEAVAVDAADTLEQGVFTVVDAGVPEPAAAVSANGLATLHSKVDTRWPIAGLLDGVLCAASLDEGLKARARLAPGESVITVPGVWLGSTWLHVRRGGAGEHGVLERERMLEALGREIEHASEEEEERARAPPASSPESFVSPKKRTPPPSAVSTKAIAGAPRCVRTWPPTPSRRIRRRVARPNWPPSSRTSLPGSGPNANGLRRRARAWSIRRTSCRIWPGSGRNARSGAVFGARSSRSRGPGGRECATTHMRWSCTWWARVRASRRRRRRAGGSNGGSRSSKNACGPPAMLSRRPRRRSRGRRRCSTRSSPGAPRSNRWCARPGPRSRGSKGWCAAPTRSGSGTWRRCRGSARRWSGFEWKARRPSFGARPWRSASKPRGRRSIRCSRASETMPRPAYGPRRSRRWRAGSHGSAPINLAAIEEYEQQAERKRYLDAQHADLEEALATLDAAIQKIDRETRTRFRETYERVNDGLGTMFPRLFGGGSAALQLTGEDLLGAGVTVVARPPGKRNTSINLLSGGEKALTAIALVFAIFELNPAPFCLLDEVDAPLDDANIGRFCELVEEMAKRVQLVLVTHNKITMEIAGQLVGITMNEPGVSRLVAVDVEEAMEMAQA